MFLGAFVCLFVCVRATLFKKVIKGFAIKFFEGVCDGKRKIPRKLPYAYLIALFVIVYSSVLFFSSVHSSGMIGVGSLT